MNSEPTDKRDSCTVYETNPETKWYFRDNSTFPCPDAYLTGFGAHIMVIGNASEGRFSGVEMFRVGQTNVLARYPIHFHMMKNRTDSNFQDAYVRDSSVHDSYFRCYAIHGTQGVKLTQNTAYNAIGHWYVLLFSLFKYFY